MLIENKNKVKEIYKRKPHSTLGTFLISSWRTANESSRASLTVTFGGEKELTLVRDTKTKYLFVVANRHALIKSAYEFKHVTVHLYCRTICTKHVRRTI